MSKMHTKVICEVIWHLEIYKIKADGVGSDWLAGNFKKYLVW